MKLSCEIVQDLLPLYADEVCSEQSKAAVKEHLQQCEKCRKLIESADNIPILELQPEKTAADKTVSKSFRRIRRRWIASLLVLLLVIPACILGWFLSQNGGPQFIYFANSFVSSLLAEKYEKAFEYLDTDSTREEWLEVWFSEEELINFEEDALIMFCQLAQEVHRDGGIQNCEYVGSRLSGYNSYADSEVYEFIYSVTIAGEDHLLTVDVTEDGVCSFGCDGSFLNDSLARFGMWTEYLWQDYSGCYYDSNTNQYVYYEDAE